MVRRTLVFGACLLISALLTACGSNANVPATLAPNINPTVAEATLTTTNNTSSSYPKLGHAPDYSWIAGWVSFTMIQGGCIYIRTDAPPATPGPPPTPGISGPIVSTAVRSDTSPPLRDMTPEPPSIPTPDVSSGVFIVGGEGWDATQWKDGDYVVAFGHVAGPNDTREMCPGGAQYVMDRVQANP
ncbi:MAG TPA: hypothetical protein VJ183_18920 [Chloroflexia bacterium]|nr:hypothetical protein [Chloroflexia bacterium]